MEGAPPDPSSSHRELTRGLTVGTVQYGRPVTRATVASCSPCWKGPAVWTQHSAHTHTLAQSPCDRQVPVRTVVTWGQCWPNSHSWGHTTPKQARKHTGSSGEERRTEQKGQQLVQGPDYLLHNLMWSKHSLRSPFRNWLCDTTGCEQWTLVGVNISIS